MVTFTVKTEMSPRLRAILADIAPETRRALFSVGANALKLEVARHIRRQVPRHHLTAARLGASATGHLEKGAARITSHSTASGAEIHVPIAGISRAFRDLTVTPVKAKALTIPIAAESYGHRVRELERMGWNVFKVKGRDLLMGERDGETKALYSLKKRVTIRQDRSLLPDDATVAGTINNAVARHIQRMINAA